MRDRIGSLVSLRLFTNPEIHESEDSAAVEAQPPAMPDVTSQQLVDISTALQQLTATFAIMPQMMASIANDTVSAALAQFQQPPVTQQPVSGGQGGDVQQQSVCQRGSEPQPPPLSASS
eukprot:SAG31_NODE_30604_length_378_cov_3.960573_1_plen_118_part_01